MMLKTMLKATFQSCTAIVKLLFHEITNESFCLQRFMTSNMEEAVLRFT